MCGWFSHRSAQGNPSASSLATMPAPLATVQDDRLHNLVKVEQHVIDSLHQIHRLLGYQIAYEGSQVADTTRSYGLRLIKSSHRDACDLIRVTIIMGQTGFDLDIAVDCSPEQWCQQKLLDGTWWASLAPLLTHMAVGHPLVQAATFIILGEQPCLDNLLFFKRSPFWPLEKGYVRQDYPTPWLSKTGYPHISDQPLAGWTPVLYHTYLA